MGVVDGLEKGASPVILATWVVGSAIALGITAWYNELRFGSIFNDGHLSDPNVVVAHNPLTGIALELISPERGLMVVMPVALVALLGWRLLRQRNELLAWYVLVAPVLYATVEGRFFNWSGADAWGPRLMVSAAALLLIPLGLVLDNWASYAKATKTLIVGLCGVSILIQCAAISILYPFAPLAISNSDAVAFHSSQVLDTVQNLLHHGQQQPWWLDYLFPHWGPGLFVSILAWLLLVSLAWSLSRVLHSFVAHLSPPTPTLAPVVELAGAK